MYPSFLCFLEFIIENGLCDRLSRGLTLEVAMSTSLLEVELVRFISSLPPFLYFFLSNFTSWIVFPLSPFYFRTPSLTLSLFSSLPICYVVNVNVTIDPGMPVTNETLLVWVVDTAIYQNQPQPWNCAYQNSRVPVTYLLVPLLFSFCSLPFLSRPSFPVTSFLSYDNLTLSDSFSVSPLICLWLLSIALKAKIFLAAFRQFPLRLQLLDPVQPQRRLLGRLQLPLQLRDQRQLQSQPQRRGQLRHQRRLLGLPRLPLLLNVVPFVGPFLLPFRPPLRLLFFPLSSLSPYFVQFFEVF